MSLQNDFKSRASQAPQVQSPATETSAPAVLNEFRELVTAGYNWITRAVRTEETSPITEQYTPSLTLYSGSNITSGTLSYYPSSAGAIVGSQQDICIQFFLSSSSGSIFTYFQITNDPGASPQWVDISQTGINYPTNNNGYTTFSVSTGSADWVVSFEKINVEKWRIKTLVDYSNVNQLCIYQRSKPI